MKNHIVGFGTNTLNAMRAGKAKPIHYILPDKVLQDKRTLGELKKDHRTLGHFNGMLARGEIKKVVGEFPNISASEIRGHLIDIYTHQSA